MKTVQPYLIFPGTCREALDFYSKCLAGTVDLMQTFAEAPVDFPEDSGWRIFNSIFRAGELQFMASDGPPDHDIPVGSNISLFVTFSEKEEQMSALEGLSRGGKVLMPLGNGFAMVEDRFQIRWMLVHDK